MNLTPRSERELRAIYGTAEVSYKQLVQMDQGYPPVFENGSVSNDVWELFEKDMYAFEDIVAQIYQKIQEKGRKENARQRVVNMIRLIDRSNDRACLLVNHERIFKPLPKKGNKNLDSKLYEGKILGVCFIPDIRST